jgi:hypothetical protein
MSLPEHRSYARAPAFGVAFRAPPSPEMLEKDFSRCAGGGGGYVPSPPIRPVGGGSSMPPLPDPFPSAKARRGGAAALGLSYYCRLFPCLLIGAFLTNDGLSGSSGPPARGRGARNFQLNFLYRLGILDAPADAAWMPCGTD